jgi:4-hydroxythreonine-4-phosphate dehydrogenase
MRPVPRARAPAKVGPALPIAVTMGDPAGIGPDITLSAWSDRERYDLPAFLVYGDLTALRRRARALGLDVPLVRIAQPAEALEAFSQALPVLPAGRGAREAVVIDTIVAATEAAAQHRVLALVTNPIAKKALQASGYAYPGHTEMLAALAGQHHGGRTFRPVMMLAARELKVVPTTVHMALAQVPKALTRTLLIETIRITAAALHQDFGVRRPRLAVAGLNPHAGEEGMLGREDLDVIAPAIAELAEEGMAVTGPHSADAMFHAAARRTYDAAIAMYHDQALIPLKTLAFDRGVNVTLGLPFVRTSPDHGTAFAIAGTGKARPGSFLAALQLAADIGRRRARASLPAQP